jgi:glycosyltransferase involved in cell wall biosynthesis
LSFRILFANVTLAGFTGTEVVTRDLALGMHGRGHHVAVYSPARGPIADELEAGGVHVVTRVDQIGEPDIVHGHHFVETVEALARFPRARGIFVCHDRTSMHSNPPRWPSIHRYVAVDDNCLERLRLDWEIPAADTRVILNAVDMARFVPRSPLPGRPGRALVFSHNASPATHSEVVRAACDRLGIELDVLGTAAGEAVAAPEARLPQYDLVFAKARCALEAMAVGTAVVLCDASGSGPMVRADNVARLRPLNFGARTLTDRLDADRLVQEIRKYDPADSAAVSAWIRRDASLDRGLDEYEDVYREVMQAPPAPERTVRPLLVALLRRIGKLEHDARAFQTEHRMPALADDDIAGIDVEFERAPETMAAGVPTFVKVRVRNRTSGPLGSWQPYPVQVACRWKTVGAVEFGAAQGARTPFYTGVAPGGTESLFVKAVPPPEPGRYILRVALVQEFKRWLDETPTPACADMTVTVMNPTNPSF